jgi:hypothetical protein
MIDYHYDIRSEWPGRPEAPVDIGRKFLQTLDAFGRIDPVFSDWGTGDIDKNPEGASIEALRPNFTDFVEDNVARDGWDRPTPDDGYDLWAANQFCDFPRASPRTMNFLIRAGSKWANDNSLTAGSSSFPPDPAIVTYPIFKAALLTMISIWPPSWANARYYVGGLNPPPTPPGEPPFPNSGFQMPWLSYLCAERSAGIVPPSGMMTERTPDGGLLMIAAKTRFDPTNRDHVKRSRALLEIMMQHARNAA